MTESIILEQRILSNLRVKTDIVKYHQSMHFESPVVKGKWSIPLVDDENAAIKSPYAHSFRAFKSILLNFYFLSIEKSEFLDMDQNSRET